MCIWTYTFLTIFPARHHHAAAVTRVSFLFIYIYLPPFSPHRPSTDSAPLLTAGQPPWPQPCYSHTTYNVHKRFDYGKISKIKLLFAFLHHEHRASAVPETKQVEKIIHYNIAGGLFHMYLYPTIIPLGTFCVLSICCKPGTTNRFIFFPYQKDNGAPKWLCFKNVFHVFHLVINQYIIF